MIFYEQNTYTIYLRKIIAIGNRSSHHRNFQSAKCDVEKNITSLGQKERVKDGSQNRGIRGETNGIQQQQQEVVSAWTTVFSFIASLLFFFLFYFFFLPVILFRFLWTFSHFCKNRGTSYNKPLVFFFFFERTLRSTLISKVGTTCLGLKNIMYSLCKYCYDQLCSFQFRLLPSRSLAFSAPIVVFLPFFS